MTETYRRYPELEKENEIGYVPDYGTNIPELDPESMIEEERVEYFESLVQGGMYEPDARELLWPEGKGTSP